MVEIFDAVAFTKAIGLSDLSAIEKSIESSIGEIKIDVQPSFNSSGELVFTRGEETFSAADLKKLSEGDLSGETPRPPDLPTLYEKLGTKLDATELDRVRAQQKTMEDVFNKSTAVEDVSNLGKVQQTAAEKNLKEPATAADFDGPEANQLKQALIEEDAQGNPSWKSKEVGKWSVTKLTPLLAGAAAATALYELVKQHQKDMSGCWLIDISTGFRCKAAPLTCGEAKSSGTICNTCIKLCDGSCPDTQFNPCPLPVNIDNCKDPDSGGVTPQNCLSCSKDSKNCSVTPNCTNDNNCDDTTCNCSKYYCGPGFQLKCVNATFWESAIDIGTSIAAPFADAVGGTLKFIKTALIVVGVCIAIGGIIYLLFKVFGGSKSESKNVDINLNLKQSRRLGKSSGSTRQRFQ